MSPKTCKTCRQKFLPSRPMQVVCSPLCAAALVAKKRREKMAKEASAERKETREKLRAMETYQKRCGRVQELANAYVRLRDRNEPCISCGKPSTWAGQWHCSHYKSVGSNSFLRFNYYNLNKSCSVCNNHLSGNISGYREGLTRKYGDWVIPMLESAPKSRKYSNEYLERMTCILRKLIKRERRRNAL